MINTAPDLDPNPRGEGVNYLTITSAIVHQLGRGVGGRQGEICQNGELIH